MSVCLQEGKIQVFWLGFHCYGLLGHASAVPTYAYYSSVEILISQPVNQLTIKCDLLA